MTSRLESRFADLNPADYALPEELRARLLSPALVVWLEHVQENVRRVIAHAGSPERWRPHVKTTKLPVIWAELMAQGVRAFKCATTREARCLLETLRREKVEGGDVLVAYPLRQPALRVLGGLADRFEEARVSVLCEDPALVPAIPPSVSVFIDVNPGMDRTGTPLADRERIHAVARAAGERFRGVHYYDGHLHGPLAERRRAAFACYDGALELLGELEAAGIPCSELVTSGTPAFLQALAYPAFRELAGTRHTVSPGTVVFHDLRTELENADLDLVPAALLFARVVSRPGEGIVTCDAGSKSIAAESGDPCAFVLGHPELEAQSPSEEHLPLRVLRGPAPELGEELLLIPYHVCPTTNLAEEVLVVDGDVYETHAVEGRAHDLMV